MSKIGNTPLISTKTSICFINTLFMKFKKRLKEGDKILFNFEKYTSDRFFLEEKADPVLAELHMKPIKVIKVYELYSRVSGVILTYYTCVDEKSNSHLLLFDSSIEHLNYINALK